MCHTIDSVYLSLSIDSLHLSISFVNVSLSLSLSLYFFYFHLIYIFSLFLSIYSCSVDFSPSLSLSLSLSVYLFCLFLYVSSYPLSFSTLFLPPIRFKQKVTVLYKTLFLPLSPSLPLSISSFSFFLFFSFLYLRSISLWRRECSFTFLLSHYQIGMVYYISELMKGCTIRSHSRLNIHPGISVASIQIKKQKINKLQKVELLYDLEWSTFVAIID